MTDLVTMICKYLIVILMVLYTILSFFTLRSKSRAWAKADYYLMNTLALMIHAAGYTALTVHQKDWRFVVLYSAELLFFLLYLGVYRTIYQKANLALLSHMVLLMSIGFIMLTRLNFAKAVRQCIMIVAAGAITLVVPKMFAKVHAARKWAEITGIIGLLILGVVLALSGKTYGANLSLSIGGISIQPSEFVKISYVLLIAVLLRERTDIRRVLFTAGVAGIHVIVLVLSTDLGSALIYALTFLLMLYVATRQPWYLAGGTVIGIGASIAAYMLFSHVRVRFQVWMNPWNDFYNKGSQVGNSLFGIATGGWFGMGLYGGRPDLIYVVEKDFIFSAICEEMGGIVGICILLICISCFLMFVVVAADLYLPFYKLTAIGLAAVYGIQVILTIGGNIKFIPSTGVTLPLISYGGSSVMSTFILFGIIQELYIKRQNEIERLQNESEEDELEVEGEYENEEE